MGTDESKKNVSAGDVLILDTYKIWGKYSLLLLLGIGLFIYALNLLLNAGNPDSIFKISVLNYVLAFGLILLGLSITVISLWRVEQRYWKLKGVHK